MEEIFEILPFNKFDPIGGRKGLFFLSILLFPIATDNNKTTISDVWILDT